MNFKRKHPRSRCRSNVHNMNNWPKWHDVVFHNRPRRRRDTKVLMNIKKGQDPDGLVFDLGNSKPHVYYW